MFWNIIWIPIPLISMSMPIVLRAFISVPIPVLLGGSDHNTTSERNVDLIVVHIALESRSLSADSDCFVRIIDRKVDVRVIRSSRDSHHGRCIPSGYSNTQSGWRNLCFSLSLWLSGSCRLFVFELTSVSVCACTFSMKVANIRWRSRSGTFVTMIFVSLFKS